MATVYSNGEDLVSGFFSSRVSDSVLGYLNNQIERIGSAVRDNTFLSHGIQQLNNFTSEAYQRSRDMLRGHIGGRVKEDIVHIMRTIEELQHAGPTMQRHIMANTKARELYLDGRIDGYGGSYNNIHGNAVGEQLYDWRRVQSGLIDLVEETNEEGEIEHTWSSTTYFDIIPEDERDLRFDEKVTIKQVWGLMENYLDDWDSDPTSKLNNSM